MSEFKHEIATEYNFPNINLYRRFVDGEFNGWKAETAEGYVMYDTTANDTELQIDPETREITVDSETGEPVVVSVTYYRTMTTMPRWYNIDKFPYVAVPRDTVDEKYIF